MLIMRSWRGSCTCFSPSVVITYTPEVRRLRPSPLLAVLHLNHTCMRGTDTRGAGLVAVSLDVVLQTLDVWVKFVVWIKRASVAQPRV